VKTLRRVLLSLSMARVTRRGAVASLLGLAACKQPEKRAEREASSKKPRMARFDLPNGGTALLMRYDITNTVIDHICREAPSQNTKIGDYYPNSKSPAFERLDAKDVASAYKAKHRDRTIIIMNCSFFERYDPATELSFPIKMDGKIVTGGSSPYGPCPNPEDSRYKAVTLKALVWNDRAVSVVDYDHTTGGVLNDPNFANAIVTYAYEDHPANVLAGDPVGSYQLMGIKSMGDSKPSTFLYTLTIERGRMVDGAAALKRHGVNGSVLTVDGGPSTHLWLSGLGDIVTTASKTLPHYLGFRARSP
jgi:hypothetical protein